jgi:hypothetical protein
VRPAAPSDGTRPKSTFAPLLSLVEIRRGSDLPSVGETLREPLDARRDPTETTTSEPVVEMSLSGGASIARQLDGS